VGIDVEPAAPLPEELLAFVATPAERRALERCPSIYSRLLVCIKEAVYKATHPIDKIFLEHHDVEVCLSSFIARTSSGRTLKVHITTDPCLLAIAVIEH
jgi:4'-phosphopantetheinyl transferase EntD